jgi:hypothetical protein
MKKIPMIGQRRVKNQMTKMVKTKAKKTLATTTMFFEPNRMKLMKPQASLERPDQS